MTCIVAVAGESEVVVGGDTLGTSTKDPFRIPFGGPKVFRNGPYLVGFTSSFRMGQILQFEADLPEPPECTDDAERFLVTRMVPFIKDLFEKHGFKLTGSFPSAGKMDFQIQGIELGGLFILAFGGRIFEIREDFHVSRPAEPYTAIGTGAPVALGALSALATAGGVTLRRQAEIALESASRFCSVVGGRVDVLSSTDT